MRPFALTSFAAALACLAPLSLSAGSITLPVTSAGLLMYYPPSPTPFFIALTPSETSDLSVYSDARYGRNEIDIAIEFDLGALQGHTVLSAALDLTANGSQMITLRPSLSVTPFLDDDPVVDPSDFTKSTGSTLYSNGSLPLFAAPDTIVIPLSIDVTRFVTQALATSMPHAGFNLSVLQAEVSLDGLGTGGTAPHLVVTVAGDPAPTGTVPEPPGMMLLGMGLACLGIGRLGAT